MALWKDENQGEVAVLEVQCRPTSRNKKKQTVNSDDGPTKPPKTTPPKRKSRRASKLETKRDDPRTDNLQEANSMREQMNEISVSTSRKEKKSKTKRASVQETVAKDAEPEKDPIKHTLAKRKSKKKSKKVEREIASMPPPSSSASPPAPKASTQRRKSKTDETKVGKQQTEPTLNFLQSLEQANEDRKQRTKKKKKKSKLSQSHRDNIQNEINKRKERKAKLKACPVDDGTIKEIGWFTMKIKENSTRAIEPEESDDEDTAKQSKKKEKKQLRSTVDYSREYSFSTRQQMEETTGYYLHMIRVKKRSFHVDNLFVTKPFLSRVYRFDIDKLEDILHDKEDKWWINSRLALYQQEEEEHWEEDKDEIGMEALGIFFGPNKIDQDPEHDDNSVVFSVASVESVHFSDDDDNQELYKGKLREKVEVMPGEFKLIRKEEETYDAIESGNYMSSLCLGCGVALVSVQDAREVACPTCGSITPLNGVSLHKPFGIATGIKRVKVEHLLAPRKSISAATIGCRGSPPGVTSTSDGVVTLQGAKKGSKTDVADYTTKESSKLATGRKPRKPSKNGKDKGRPDKAPAKPGAVRVSAR